ncbi:MAG: hypothetical protein ACOYOU_21840 [Kiritimatiellia bacterium]
MLTVTSVAAQSVTAPKSTVYLALDYSGERWQNSTYWTGADWARVGKDWQHPGTGAPSVRRFAIPEDGKITISGRVSKTKSPILVPRFVARNQIQVTEPGGKIGALGSTLMRQLRAGHKTVTLTDAELRTLAAWIDLNAVFYGSCDLADNAKELRGEPIAMPEIQ